MRKKSVVSVWVISRMMAAASVVALAACAGGHGDNQMYPDAATPTVDYIETLDVYSAPHRDSFLNQLAMNYRSYAIYNARTSGYPDMGELFAQKAVAAFSGEVPFPETLDNWQVADDQTAYELSEAYNDLLEQLKNDATDDEPQLAAEAQAKFDCWLSAAASGQDATAMECRGRFLKTMDKLRECRTGTKSTRRATTKNTTKTTTSASASNTYYPETRSMAAVRGTGHAREGVIIVNNVNVPDHLINPVPVQPLVFNQNIYSNDGGVVRTVPMAPVDEDCEKDTPTLGEEFVSRAEFINMMMAMREELAAINKRLDKLQAAQGEKTMIKVQQIPLEPTQHVMEEILEIRFDFNKATIKPEYDELIRKLATATQGNKNIKVSVVGHTDTMGSKNYNYALGGRRAEAVQKMLIQYGIPASQIVAVSAGEEDLKVPTPDGVANAENRRVRVVKEVHYEEPAKTVPVAIEVEEYVDAPCGEYGCAQ